jgi:polysaccharide biosynthesis transport protein
MCSVVRELEFHAGRLPGHADPDQEADRKPLNYSQLALRYRWWLILGGAMGLLLGQLAYWKSGPEYVASAQILVSRKNSVPLPEEQRTLGSWGERSEHIALIMSPMIVSKAVELGELRKLKTFEGSTEIVEDVLDGLLVKRSSGQDRSYLNVLTITFTSKYADDARTVVQAIIAGYAAYLEETREEKSGEVLSIAQQAHDEMLQKLKEKEQEYTEFRDSAPLQWKTHVGGTSLDGQTTTNVHQERVVAFEEERRKNLLKQAEYLSRLQSIDEAIRNGEPRDALEVLIRRFLNMDGPGGGDMQRQQDLSIFENRLLPLMLEEQRLLRDYGKDHPDVVQVRKSIETTTQFYREQGIRLLSDPPLGPDGKPLRAMGKDFIAIYIDSLKQQLAELKIRDRELEKFSAIETEKAKEMARYQAKDQAMNSELIRLRELWGQLVTKVNQVGIERGGSGYGLKQIAPVRDELSLKRMMKFWGAGTVFGAVMVAALCVLRELRDTRLKTVDDLRALLRQPVLGTVTRFTLAIDRSNPLVQQAHPGLRYLLAPQSLEAENYRSLRTALNIVAESAEARVIQVSSPEPGDGKTTTVSNLAIAMAQSGKRVLLVDADLRRPNIHRLFRLGNERGLVDLLQGTGRLDSLVQPSLVLNLSVLPSGAIPDNPSELLSSPRLTSVLADARDDYDVVFVDGPPLLAVSDPCVIGRHVDGLLLVLRLGKSSTSSAVQSRDLIRTHGLRVLGVVANGKSRGDNGDYSYEVQYYQQYTLGRDDDQVNEEAAQPVGAGA